MGRTRGNKGRTGASQPENPPGGTGREAAVAGPGSLQPGQGAGPRRAWVKELRHIGKHRGPMIAIRHQRGHGKRGKVSGARGEPRGAIWGRPSSQGCWRTCTCLSEHLETQDKGLMITLCTGEEKGCHRVLHNEVVTCLARWMMDNRRSCGLNLQVNSRNKAFDTIYKALGRGMINLEEGKIWISPIGKEQ